MSGDNPYEVTTESSGTRAADERDTAAVEVSTRTIEMLNQTRPWVQFMGVLLWLSIVLMAIAAVALIAIGLGGGDQGFLIIGPVYLILVFVYVFIALALTKYANRIKALNASETVKDLEDALEAQKNFWRLVGIITLVFIVLYVLFLLLMIAGVAFLPNLMKR